jgi:hypothetical protein
MGKPTQPIDAGREQADIQSFAKDKGKQRAGPTICGAPATQVEHFHRSACAASTRRDLAIRFPETVNV